MKHEKAEDSKTEDKAEDKGEDKGGDSAKAGDVNGDGKIVVGYISKNIVDPFHAPINDYAKGQLDKMGQEGKIDEWTGILDGETCMAENRLTVLMSVSIKTVTMRLSFRSRQRLRIWSQKYGRCWN